MFLTLYRDESLLNLLKYQTIKLTTNMSSNIMSDQLSSTKEFLDDPINHNVFLELFKCKSIKLIANMSPSIKYYE